MMQFPLNTLLDEQACYEFLLHVLHPGGLACPLGLCVLIWSETDAVPRSVSNRASGVAYDYLNHTDSPPELDRC